MDSWSENVIPLSECRHAENAGANADESLASVPAGLAVAVSEWKVVVGPENVLDSSTTLQRYASSTLPYQTLPLAVVRPFTVEEIQSVLQISSQQRIPSYPISCGKNWGYGCANPTSQGCVIIDLSRMDKILHMNDELGIVTVQPGVTQRHLNAYLFEQSLNFLVPVTGAGPDASVVGNAVERGYGITPYSDHFGAVIALEAVLPNGEIYRSPHCDLGVRDGMRSYKWGIGPYTDGLFTQGNFGIVTEMSIALAPKPKSIETFFFFLRSEKHLEEAVTSVRDILGVSGCSTGAINLMNARRVIATKAPYPWDSLGKDNVVKDEEIDRLMLEHGVAPWVGFGALYGDACINRTAKRLLKRKLKPLCSAVQFIKVQSFRNIMRYLPWLSFVSRRTRFIQELAGALDIVSGIPSEVAMPLAYWRLRHRPARLHHLDPTNDGCGLIWYSPIVPMQSSIVRDFVTWVSEICRAHGMEPLITLTTMSRPNCCFSCSLPLLFDPKNENESDRADRCYRVLVKQGMAKGFMPYRTNTSSMHKIVDEEAPYWRLVEVLKRAVDPGNILAPGRYSTLSGSPPAKG